MKNITNTTMNLFALFFMAIGIIFPVSAQVPGALDDVFSSQPEFLDVEQAFVFDFTQKDQILSATFTIADGYYLYKKQFKYVAKEAEIGSARYPQGVMIEDEFFGESEVFYNSVSIDIPITQASQDGVVKIRYQGCADAGLCYPPTVKVVYLNEVGSNSVEDADATTESNSASTSSSSQSEQFDLAQRLIDKDNLALTLALFFALGVGLAFTPCVFPMYPIVSGIVIGQGKPKTASHSFWLTFVYVQGMAITYINGKYLNRTDVTNEDVKKMLEGKTGSSLNIRFGKEVSFSEYKEYKVYRGMGGTAKLTYEEKPKPRRRPRKPRSSGGRTKKATSEQSEAPTAAKESPEE